MEQRNERKLQIGKVVSDKMDKTIVVAVETYKKSTTFIISALNTPKKSLKRMMKTTMRKSAM